MKGGNEKMVKVTYIDGSTQHFDANEWVWDNEDDVSIQIIKRKFDSDGDYDTDNDVTVAEVATSQIRSIEND